MFDIGWSEMAVIAILALIVIGPKDLPRAMQSVGRWVRKARSLTREFQAGLDDMVREADLEDARKAVESSRGFDMKKSVLDTIDPTGEVEKEAADLDRETRAAARGEDVPAKPLDSAPAPYSLNGGGTAPEAPKQEQAQTPTAAGTPKAKTPKATSPKGASPKAKVVSSPAQIAPGNSVRPPSLEPSTTTGAGVGASAEGPQGARPGKAAGRAKKTSG